jgi:hypothetical protein
MIRRVIGFSLFVLETEHGHEPQNPSSPPRYQPRECVVGFFSTLQIHPANLHEILTIRSAQNLLCS